MLQLILHHTYKLLGEAVDVSGLGTHGRSLNVNYLPDGIAPGSGSIGFDQPGSRVRVKPHPVWRRLRALKIEAWVKVDALGVRQNIIEGDGSFAFFIHPDGELLGTFYAPMTAGGPITWHGASSVSNAVNGEPYYIPVGEWIKLTYLHDGFASLRLYVDDRLVAANYGLISAVPGVSGYGVHIGNWPAGDRFTFAGEIDEVKIWRYDADQMTEQFFCRPVDATAASCLAEVLNHLNTLREDPETWERTLLYLRCIHQNQQKLIRAVRGLGEDAIRTAQDFSRRYQDLWCAGKINGPEMETLMYAWRDWLAEVATNDFDVYLNAVQECWDAYGADLPLPDVDLRYCDGNFAGYLRTLMGLV